MCYASPVMLRGRGSRAILERPTPSPFALSSLFRMLSPIIPVHPRDALVSPIIPVHTQKQGAGGLKKLSAASDQRSGSKKKAALSPDFSDSPLVYPERPSRRATRLPRAILAKGHSPLSSMIPGDFNRLENSAPSCRLSAVNCEPVLLTPSFTTTSINIVGAPTIWSAAASRRFSRSSDPRAQARVPVPPKAREIQEHRQECLCHQRQEKPKSTGKSACATKGKRNPRAQARVPVPPNPGETQDPPSQNEDGAPGRSIVS